MRIQIVGVGAMALLASVMACSSEDDEPNELGTGGYGNGGYGNGGYGNGGYGNGGVAGLGGVMTGGTPSAGFPNAGGGPASGGFPGAGGSFTAGGAGGSSPGGAASGGSSGGTSPGGAASGGSGGGANTDARPPCMKNPRQVISIGDSFMSWPTHTFPQDLNAAAGVTYRPTYAVGGFSMASGGLGLIPPQFDQALAQDPNIIAVVMDGGGNDLLIPALGRPDCKNMANSASNPGCQAILTDALAAVDRLATKMAQANVHDVIYYFYPYVPAPTLLGGSHPNVMLDYALPKVRAACDGVAAKTNNKLSCWFVDLIPVFKGHNDWFAAGDIHPTPAGSKAMAKAVYDTMKSKCIAQPASSGCCAP